MLAPLIASVAIVALRATGLAAGRIATSAAGIATAAAIGLVAFAAADDDGTVGDVLGIGADRAGALLLVAVTGTGAVVAGFSRRNVDDEARTTGYFALLGVVVGASTLVVLPGGPDRARRRLAGLRLGADRTDRLAAGVGHRRARRPSASVPPWRSATPPSSPPSSSSAWPTPPGLPSASGATTTLADFSVFGIEATHVFACSS